MKRYLKLVILYIVIVFLLSTITYASTETSISNAVTRDEIEENSLEESVSGEIETFSDFTYGNYQYTENPDGTVKITKYTGNEQNVSIPSSINGKKVTIIGAAAFYNKTSIQTVIIPDTVTDLETGAFMFCENLTSITLGNSLKTIGDCAFESCSFTEIKIPASDKIKFQVVEKVKEYAKQANYPINDIDGLRITYTNGWAVVRASNTGGNITFRAEADTQEGVNILENIYIPMIKSAIATLSNTETL